MSYHPRLNRKSSSQSSSKKKRGIFTKRPFLSEEKRIEEEKTLQRYSAEEIQQRLEQAVPSYLDRDEYTPEEKNNAGETTEVNASQTTEAVQAKCDGREAKTETDEDKQPIQTKLTVGAPDDQYEKEADATAEKVVQMINSPATSESVQNKEDWEENPEIQTKVMAKGGNGGGEVDEQIEQGINGSRGSGQRLGPIQEPMEQAFGADFSKVKIHTDGNADQLNKSLNSRAFATGQDIFFKQGEYNPGSRQGQELLAHELTHVVQQNGDQVQPKEGKDSDSNSSEKESDNTNITANTGIVQGQEISGSPALEIRRHLRQARDSGQELSTVSSNLLQRKCSGDKKSGMWNFEYDGCSVPSWIPINKDNPAGGRDTIFGNSASREAPCDKHDECYQTCGSNRAICDKQMLQRMKNVCKLSRESKWVKLKCRMWARLYYIGLRVGGSPAHKERQKEVCSCDPGQKKAAKKVGKKIRKSTDIQKWKSPALQMRSQLRSSSL